MIRDPIVEELAHVTGGWLSPTVHRVYPATADGHVRFVAESRVLASHGYTATPRAAPADRRAYEFARRSQRVVPQPTYSHYVSAPYVPLGGRRRRGPRVRWPSAEAVGGAIGTAIVVVVVAFVVVGGGALFWFAGQGGGTRSGATDPPSQRLSPIECRRLGDEWQEQKDRFDALQVLVEARQAGGDPAGDVIDQQQRPLDRMLDLVDRMERGGCEV